MDAAALAQLLIDVADTLIVPRWRALGDDEVMQKRPGDLVTVADREAEAAIADALAAAFPDALVVGEEAAFADGTILDLLPDAPHAFVIDPVDGTRNFAAGSPDFGVMLAETRHGEATRGWIWQPIRRTLYTVERGAGVTRDGTPLAPVERRTPWGVAGPRRFRGHGNPAFTFTWTHGACAIDYPLLAQGGVDALVYTTVHPWDHLAGVLMVRELGGESARVGADRPWRLGGDGGQLLVGSDADILAALAAHAATLP